MFMVDPARVQNCIVACCAEISITSVDADAPELTQKARGLAILTRCRKSNEYNSRALEELFLWDLGQKMIPAELKRAMVQEAYAKGFKEPAARLGVYIGIATEGDAGAMVNEVPAVSVLALKTLPNAERLFQDLVRMLDHISITGHTQQLDVLKSDFPARLNAFTELLCRRVDRYELWTALSAKFSRVSHAPANYDAGPSLAGEPGFAVILQCHMTETFLQLRMGLLTVLRNGDIDDLEKTNANVSRPRLVKLLIEQIKHARNQDEIAELSALMSSPVVANVERDAELRANNKEAYFALAEESYAKKAYCRALSFYLDGLAVHSHNFAMTLLLDVDRAWMAEVLPRIGQCAALCEEYFLATVLSQLYSVSDSSVPFELLDKALESIVEDRKQIVLDEEKRDIQYEYTFLVEDRGYPDNVISTLWNLDLLEYAVAYFKRIGDSATMQLLIRVIGRPEASAAAHDSYASMVLSRYLRHCRQKLGSA
ncbi:hypothetical protein HDU86_004762 [Geranomyces michiganensis]|nr:hypothetical protein HDU86_004762 [Geranomyces michiganensis]